MNKTDIRPGVLYLNFGGGDTLAVEAKTVSIERLDGTGHLSRGARGFIDRCVFPGLPNLTGEPLKRKVIRVLQDDIDGEAVEASVSCIEKQVKYLLGLPDARKPKVIVYQAAVSVSEDGLVESFVAVDGDFSDDVFFDLYESPGYPEFKRSAVDFDYIPEFLRKPHAKQFVGVGDDSVPETEAQLRMHGSAALGEEASEEVEAKGGWHDEPWKGYPAGLKEMMLGVYHDDGTYSPAQLVRRLSLEISEADVENPPDCLERITWVDRFMRDCAMDFTCHPDLWESSSGAIEELLRSVDNLLAALCRTEAIEIRAYKSGASDEDPTALAQRVNVYCCVSAALMGDIDEFHERLSRAVSDTEANVEHLIASPSADSLIEKEDTTRYGFYLPGQRYFTEPLALLADYAVHIGKANQLAVAYREYIEFLEGSGTDSRGVRDKLLLDAEHILGRLLNEGKAERYEEGDSAPAAGGDVLPGFLPHWGAPRLREHCLFGRDHGGEPLSWEILDIQDGKTFLLSDRIVDVNPYADNDRDGCVWEESALGEFISTELVYDLFSSGERAYIEGPPRILSALEMERCYPRDEDRVAYPTAFARSKGAKVDAHGAGAYWTSTQGDACRIAFVRPDGDIDARGWRQDDKAGLGVRLAITLRVDVRAYSRLYSPDVEEIDSWDGR